MSVSAASTAHSRAIAWCGFRCCESVGSVSVSGGMPSTVMGGDFMYSVTFVVGSVRGSVIRAIHVSHSVAFEGSSKWRGSFVANGAMTSALGMASSAVMCLREGTLVPDVVGAVGAAVTAAAGMPSVHVSHT